LGQSRVKAINQQKTLLNKEGANKKSGRRRKKESPKEEGGGTITSETPRSNSDRHGVWVLEGMGVDSFSAQ